MTTSLDHNGVQSFEAHRRALTGLAYRMLGSRADAEDVVQDAYLRWHAADHAQIEEPRRYLGTVVTRLCLDRMKSAKARREIYVGPWLPEPLVDEALDAQPAGDLAQDLSVALMLVLERLSPLERASFLLHDIFGLDFAEVGRALDRSEATCRQLAARGRAHIEEGRNLASAFMAAAQAGDLQTLADLLAKDAVLYSDGGGKRAAALNPIYGPDKIVRFIEAVARKNTGLAASQVRPATVNGRAGFVVREEDGLIDTMAFEVRDGRVAAIYVVRNPDKLRHVKY